MVFLRVMNAECLPLCHTFCTVVDVEISSNVFAFVVNVSDGRIKKWPIVVCPIRFHNLKQ